jgi:secreted PhoX family phosphatase
MGSFDRRSFLLGAAATTGGVFVGGSVQAAGAGAAGAHPPRPPVLGPVADLRDGRVRLHLPPGFRYRSFHDTDGPPVVLHDDTVLPGRHDGMAAFDARGRDVWVIRNHEQNGSAVGGAFGPGTPYDPSALGGTTSSLVTPFGEVLDSFTSLNGTQMNCAGGAMPWGSWITCEETVNGPDVFDDFTRNIPTPSPPTTYVQNARLTQPHGFIFEVPVGEQSDRVPVTHAGRFAHEAAAYSRRDRAVYLTEDNFGFPSGLYRYLPPVDPMRARRLEDGGELQMLKVRGVEQAHLEAQQAIGASYRVEWVTIDEPFPGAGRFPVTGAGTPTVTNDEAIRFVGDQGRAQGAAHFSRLEGATFTRGEVWFTSTQGGGPAETGPQPDLGYGRGTGQVWSYDPGRSRLTCRYQAPAATSLDLPDNITARNDRGTVVLCEDGPAPNYIRGLTRRGTLFDIALNQLTRNAPPNAPRFGEEFAGPTFSPDGHTLFVNIQASQAISFAIWGPWGRIGV